MGLWGCERQRKPNVKRKKNLVFTKEREARPSANYEGPRSEQTVSGRGAAHARWTILCFTVPKKVISDESRAQAALNPELESISSVSAGVGLEQPMSSNRRAYA